jgi:beta-glucosidase
MSQPRFFLALALYSMGVGALLADGCASPSRVSDTGGTTGSSGGSQGLGGNGNSGQGGTGNVIIILGSGGMSGSLGGATGPQGGSNGAGGVSGGLGGTPGAGGAMKMACGSATSDPLPYTSGYTPDSNVRSMAMSTATAMAQGTAVDELVQQMSGLPQSGTANYNVFKQEDNTSRGIKGFFFRDGPRGVNLSANSDSKGDFSTAFPVAIARGAAFDDTLEYNIGQAIGDELIASGNTMMLAPTVNILRHPAWGRAQETYGEDSFLLGRLGSAFTQGVQQYGAACAKHYAANNIENGRETAAAVMNEQTLREVYARHFGMIVKEGGVSAVMASYNQVGVSDATNSVYRSPLHSTQNGHLLTDILRTDFGFQGFVLSDWWAMPGGNTVPYPAASTLQPNALQAVQAGLDMELPWRYNYSTLGNLVTAGMVQKTQLITSAERILEQKMRFKVNSTSGALGLRTPFTSYNSNSSIDKNDQTDPALGMSHIALAQQAAEEGMVLLKNDNNTLPLSRSALAGKTIAVIGAKVNYQLQNTASQDSCTSMATMTATVLNCSLDFTTNVRTGDAGSSRVFSDPAKSKGPAAGIMAAATGINVMVSNSASAAASADFVVVIAGLTPQDEGEEYTGAGDRTTGATTDTSHTVNFGLDPKQNSGTQNNLITQVAAMHKPMVVVLEGGSIIDTSAWYSMVPAVVMAWYPGMVGGTALGRLLFGDVSFSGKLPLTWDTTVSHWPQFAGSSGTTQMDYYVGYHYFDHNGTALSPSTGSFPFGYGMSYTTFQYHDLVVPCSTVAEDGVVQVTVQVTNTGTAPAPETVFLFVSYPSSAVATRAGGYRELKAYRRTPAIPAGATALVPLSLRIKDLKYWDTASSSWKTESGPIKVTVTPNAGAAACTGGSGSGCSLSDTVTVN